MNIGQREQIVLIAYADDTALVTEVVVVSNEQFWHDGFILYIVLKSVLREVLQREPLNIGQRELMVLAIYAYDIVVIAKTVDNLKGTTKQLTDSAKKIGLIINKSKIKCMIVFRSIGKTWCQIQNFVFLKNPWLKIFTGKDKLTSR